MREKPTVRTCVVMVLAGGGEDPVYHVMRGPLRRRAGTPYFDSTHAEIVHVFRRDRTQTMTWNEIEEWYARIATTFATPAAPAVPWQGGPR